MFDPSCRAFKDDSTFLFFRVSPKTLLTFCTNGVLLRTLMGNEEALSTVTHVIVVGAHSV